MTEEQKEKISAALKGRMPKNIDSIKGWNKGTGRKSWCNDCGKETKARNNPIFCKSCSKKGDRNPMFGKETSDLVKEKIRQTHSKHPERLRYWAGRHHPRKGDNHHWWKGGKTVGRFFIANSIEYKEWRRKVFKRDDYTCQSCGKRGAILNADHIKPFSMFPELRLELSNGRTLCRLCHLKTNTWGRKAINYGQNEPIRENLSVV